MSTPVAIRPRPVFCVTDHLHRDLQVADDICAGRFTLLGITRELGVTPDWRGADLPSDEEWRIEWSKFAYGLDLAHAFGLTGDRRYVATWERLVLSWIEQVSVGSDPSDVTGRRILHWIYAWNSIADAAQDDGLTPGLDAVLLASLEAQVRHLRTHLTPERNHRTLELYALFVAALAFPDVTWGDGPPLLAEAMDELERNLQDDFLPDGVQREASTHYHMVALRSFLGAGENARRVGLVFSPAFYRRLERACDFALYVMRPDGQIPALSDSDGGDYTALLDLASRLFDRPDLRYAATAGAQGTPPRLRQISFPDGGYFVQRSGWGTNGTPYRDGRYLVFDCGPLGAGGHGHYDLLHCEIAAHGATLLCDPGRYTYAEGVPNWRHWFKGTAAHNTVCVDGLDQTPYRPGKPKGPVAQGRLVRRVSGHGLDEISGEVVSPAYDAIHTRTILFVADSYWLIIDRLRSHSSHHYDLRFHLGAEAWQRTSLKVDGPCLSVRTPDMVLATATAAAAPTAQLEPGWLAPSYGIKVPAPVVSVATTATDTWFVSAVFPLKINATPPSLATVRWSDEDGCLLVEVTGVGTDGQAADYIVWHATNGPFELGRFNGRAAVAYQRSAADGTPLAFSAVAVEDLRIFGATPDVALPVDAVAWDRERGLRHELEGQA